MKYTVSKYILGLLAVSVPMLQGCTDDFFSDGPVNALSTDAVSFTAKVATVGSGLTRAAYQPYEPLVLNDNEENFPLYLHTYEHPMGDDYADNTPGTRGNQVNTVEDLYNIHSTFGVKGDIEADGSSYIPLQKARMLTAGDNRIWTTESPQRWPGEKKLTFNAIAPFSHLDKLVSPKYRKNEISFRYTAQKSNNGTDAEAQTDLLTAVSTMNREATADYNYRVPLKFYHALSAVKFAVRDVLKGEVVSISVSGIKGSGDCVFTADDNSQNGKFTWTTFGDNQTYLQNFNQKIENGNFDPTDDSKDVLLNTQMPEKTFFFIPQALTGDAEIEVVIKRDNIVAGLPETIRVKGKILDNDVKEWKAGYEYIYTISTSKDNWVYVFDAQGNQAKGTDNIYVYNPSADEFTGLGNTAYFDVQSYRYKANDQNHVEALPWSASHGGSLSYWIDGTNETAYPQGNPQLKNVTASQWITDKSANKLRGPGIADKSWERHELDFLPHYVSTNWKGDETMQGHTPYTGYAKDRPYDLSTFGGKRARTTANCYVVDRGGWYMLPLVYGNAIKNGATNSAAYTSQSTLTPTITTFSNGRYSYKRDGGVLKTLTDYQDNAITQPYIKNVNANCRAMLIWQDAYGMIDNVEIANINGEYMLRFHVESDNLQQGNAIVALTDRENGTVMWSWHIWATEHWLDPNTGLPHVYDTGNSYFSSFLANAVTGIRERGDVAVTYQQGSKGPFYMSPYNLGWCDPKKVLYLKRKNQMDFVQYLPDGTTRSGKTDQLPIIQDGVTIEYKYANNTYYQWGRKDPMRGYFNLESTFKAIFGTRLSTTEQQGNITIGKAIQNPQAFYGLSGSNYSPEEDWLRDEGYLNLWNNHAGISGVRTTTTSVIPSNSTYDNFWVHLKTVYDPSPAGYMVPNAGVFHVVHKNVENWYGAGYSLEVYKEKLNGEYIDENTCKIWGNGIANDNNAIFFSSTGNRWWAGATNQSHTVSFAWSNRSVTGNLSQIPGTTGYGNYHFLREAYSLAIGYDDPNYRLSGQFYGRRAMGRPVRAIREP